MSEEATKAPEKPRVIVVKDVIDGAKLKKDLSYSLMDLDNAFQNQASLYVDYGRLEAQAARQVDDLELLKDVTASKLYRKMRDEVVAAKQKVVVSDLKEDVMAHPQMIAIRRALNEAKQIHANTKTTLEAFKQRKDMLVQQGAKDRQEREGELRMRSTPDATNARIREAMTRKIGSQS
jgi:hypothetical protein